MLEIRDSVVNDFNPLPPCGGRLPDLRWCPIRRKHFNPLPPCGGRLLRSISLAPAIQFQSTPSVWRETNQFVLFSAYGCNFNPLPPCGGRPRKRRTFLLLFSFQSTPSVWRETRTHSTSRRFQIISIHSLRVEGDRTVTYAKHQKREFQSTPSVWRETGISHRSLFRKSFQSTPSVWRETVSYTYSVFTRFSFQSTPSVWRETRL